MPAFLENALSKEATKKGLTGKSLKRYVFGGMNDIGAMRGNKETPLGAMMERQHEQKAIGSLKRAARRG